MFAAVLLCASLVAWPAVGKKDHHQHHKHHQKQLRAPKQTVQGEVDLLSVIQQSKETDERSSKNPSQATVEKPDPLKDLKPEDIDAQIEQLTKEDSQLPCGSTSSLAEEEFVPKLDVQVDTLTKPKVHMQIDTQPKGDIEIDTLTQIAQDGEPKIEDQLQQVAAVEADTEASFRKAFGGDGAHDDSLRASAASLPMQSEEQPVLLGKHDSLEANWAMAEAESELKVAAKAPKAPSAPKVDENVRDALRSKDEVRPKTQETDMDEKDAKEIDGYITKSDHDQLRKKLQDMAKHGGTARIHGAVRALQKMGYTGQAVNDWVMGANLQDSLSPAVRQKGATPALDAKLMYLALKKGQRSELRKVVNTLFRYGGVARVQRAQQIFSMWLKHDEMPQPESQKTFSLLERETLADFASVKQELAKSDAAEMMERLKHNDMQGLGVFITKVRGDGGEQRVLAASREVQRDVQTTDILQAPASHSPMQQFEDVPLQQQVLHETHDANQTLQNLDMNAKKEQAPAAYVPVQPPAKSPAPDFQKRRGRTEPKRDLVALAMQAKQQAQIDATVLATYLKKQDNIGLKAAYREMRNHGGWQRVDEAEKLARTMTQ